MIERRKRGSISEAEEEVEGIQIKPKWKTDRNEKIWFFRKGNFNFKKGKFFNINYLDN